MGSMELWSCLVDHGLDLKSLGPYQMLPKASYAFSENSFYRIAPKHL